MVFVWLVFPFAHLTRAGSHAFEIFFKFHFTCLQGDTFVEKVHG